ncbi:DMT family transporter [Sphingosinicella soli]|uniref:S-adenosylmethionine uptake transporter n=1 Tax=Sphingosinicella soli TaxID=333708 RepID=A0A7W7B133_9SPHN|nr:DMT family transporter [Sphingosinicella soli]MBB4632096.1 S-adenosylmethionine uptake transporter [Sphingosinicella soli]
MRLSSAPPMLLAFLGIALLCAMDAAIKLGAQSHAIITVTFMRYFAGALIALPLMLHFRKAAFSRDALQGHAVRGLVIAGAAYLFFYGLWAIPIAEAIAISFIAPLLVPLIARVLLGERMRAINIAACLVGFGGVLVTVTGQVSLPTPNRTEGVVAVLVSAVLYALSVVLLRQRATRDDPHVISFLAAAFPALYTAPFAVFAAPLPSPGTIPLFALMGALGTGGILLLAFAYARAEAQKIVVLEYTALGWGALFGWWVFGETVRAQVVLGGAIVAAACLMAAWSGRRKALPA